MQPFKVKYKAGNKMYVMKTDIIPRVGEPVILLDEFDNVIMSGRVLKVTHALHQVKGQRTTVHLS